MDNPATRLPAAVATDNGQPTPPSSTSTTAGLEQSAWTAQEKRVLQSARYKQLQSCAGNMAFELGCLERQIIAAVAPEKSLSYVVGRIQEIYDEIRKTKCDMIQGAPALRIGKQKCTNANCDNEDPNEFIPSRGGAVACRRCGDCQSDYVIHEGEMYRNFTGEEDRSHHGPVLNPLYSASYNLGTQFTGLRGQKRNTGRETDFSVSNIGRDAAAVGGTLATRVEYKDDQKSKAFRIMREQGANLALHGLVRKKSSELFAAYRDARDRLYDFDAVVAACLIAAHLEVLVEEGSDGSRATFSFACPACGVAGFTAKRDADKHCVVSMGPSYSSSGGSGGGASSCSGAELPGLSGMGSEGEGEGGVLGTRKASSNVAVDPEIHKLNLAETRRLLLWVSQGAPYQVTAVDGICKGLQAELKSLAAKGNDSDDEEEQGVEGEKLGWNTSGKMERESEYKAGQLLIMASLKVLTGWCGNDQEAGRLFHDYLQGVKKRKSERDALREEKEQDRKRRRQHEEKPIFQELAFPCKINGGNSSSSSSIGRSSNSNFGGEQQHASP